MLLVPIDDGCGEDVVRQGETQAEVDQLREYWVKEGFSNLVAQEQILLQEFLHALQKYAADQQRPLPFVLAGPDYASPVLDNLVAEGGHGDDGLLDEGKSGVGGVCPIVSYYLSKESKVVEIDGTKLSRLGILQ